MSNENKFTAEEWEACLKVLKALKDAPFENPDNDVFGGLITKIHKNAKKNIRHESYKEKKQLDIATSLSSTLSQNALEGKALYWGENPEKNTMYTPLQLPKNCYCCNTSYLLAHQHYNRLCPPCAEENYGKRFRNVNLEGRHAILTGGRVKIGYATALRLLRSKATVVVTTRFPGLAYEQFSKETDFEEWKERLTVYGLDLRNLNAIGEFIAFYKSKFDSLDILINNAAQTIKYPDTYYLPLVHNEEKIMEMQKGNLLLKPNTTPVSMEIKKLDYDVNESTSVELSRFGLPVDNREKTSWNSKLEEVGLHELVEVNLINQMAPYMLIKELKPLFMQSEFKERFIINVTSSEGIFSYANKTIFHPHTNMTKAALNMLTLTSGKEFAESNIYMSCVDVGWVSTGAHEELRKKQFEQGYIPPLDPVDGASRIMDPIMEGIAGNYLFGVLLKNYKITSW